MLRMGLTKKYRIGVICGYLITLTIEAIIKYDDTINIGYSALYIGAIAGCISTLLVLYIPVLFKFKS